MIRRCKLLLLALAVVAAAACGGGGDDAAAEEEETASEADAGRPDDSSSDTSDPAGGAAGDDPAAGTPPGEAAPAEGDPGAPEGGAGTELGIDRTFTGEGSEPFCSEAKAINDSGGGNDAGDAEFANQMAAIMPPAEIAGEWTLLAETLNASAESEGQAIADMSPEEADAWGMAGAVVATYLADVCGLQQ